MKRLSFILLFYYASSCFSEQWEQIAESKSYAVYFYDPNTVKRNGDLVEFIELANYKIPLEYKQLKMLSSKSKMTDNCELNKIHTEQSIYFDKQDGLGNIVHADLVPNNDWVDVTTGSINGAIQSVVCGEVK